MGKAAVSVGPNATTIRWSMRGIVVLALLASISLAFPAAGKAQIGAASARCEGPMYSLGATVVGAGSVSARPVPLQLPADAPARCIQPTSATTWLVQNLCWSHCLHNHVPPVPPYPSDVLLTPSGSYFLGWSRECQTRSSPLLPRNHCVITVDRDQSVVATFGDTPDSQPPTQPTIASTSAGRYSATISWTQSTDETWLGGYGIYVDDELKARASRATTTWSLNLTCARTYSIRVAAFDANNETSSASVSIATGECLSGGGTSPLPNTVIHVKPPKVTRKRVAFFHFGSGAVRATKYRCKLDRRAWRKCSGKNGVTYRRLKPGRHVFRVRAGNANGWDPTPAKYRWRIRR